MSSKSSLQNSFSHSAVIQQPSRSPLHKESFSKKESLQWTERCRSWKSISYKGSVVFAPWRFSGVYTGWLGRLRNRPDFILLLMKPGVYEGHDHVETREHCEVSVFTPQDEVGFVKWPHVAVPAEGRKNNWQSTSRWFIAGYTHRSGMRATRKKRFVLKCYTEVD